MDPADKSKMRGELVRGREALREAVRGLSDTQATLRPAAGGWSVLDCVEHLALTEEYLLGQIEAAAPSETPVGSEARARRIAERAGDRSRAVPAPEMVHPQGRFTTLSKALAAFDEARARTLRFVEGCAADPRTLATSHPLLGPANCHELLLMMALHPVRHSAQIQEIRAALV